MKNRFWLLFSLLIVVKLFLALAIVIYYKIPLAPDEAQYWTWSQALDFGYYSKPPAIAWQIWLGTHYLGDTELGVRIGSIIFSFLTSFVIYRIALACRLSEEIGFWSGLIFAYSPLGFYLSIAATTDAGSIFFIAIFLFLVCRELNKKSPSYLLAGLALGCAALFKWTAYFFWIPIGVGALFFPLFRNKTLIWAVFISCLGLIPSIIWNATHDWATFQHVGNTLYQKGSSSSVGNPLAFFLAQVGILSPLFFLFFTCGLFLILKHFKKQPTSFLFIALISASLFMYVFCAYFKKMQPNWALYLYPAATVLAAYFGVEKMRKGLSAGIITSLLFVAFGLSIPYLNLSYKLNPFQQNLGWNHLEEILSKSTFDPKKDFLIADKYQMASLLSFYNKDQIRAHFFNISQMRKNQFSYWEGLEEQKGKTAYFVFSENKIPKEELLNWYQNHYVQKLMSYFSSVEMVGSYPLFENKGEPVKFAMVFRCRDYNGQKPLDPHIY